MITAAGPRPEGVHCPYPYPRRRGDASEIFRGRAADRARHARGDPATAGTTSGRRPKRRARARPERYGPGGGFGGVGAMLCRSILRLAASFLSSHSIRRPTSPWASMVTRTLVRMGWLPPGGWYK